MTSSEHEPERELEILQEQADGLGEQISEVRDDWEAKKADAAVPGADGDPLAARSDHAEDQFPGVGDSDSVTAEEPLDTADPANEDL